MHFYYNIECPVSVLSSGRGRKWTIARGCLHDIGESGAHIFLNEPLPAEARFALDIHLPNPDSKVTETRFQARVTGGGQGPPYEMALSVLGRGEFIRGKVTEFQEGFRLLRPIESDRWIN